MKKAEINTLIANGVDPQLVEIAEAMGAIESALNRARWKVEDAICNTNASEWRELFRVMEQTVNKGELRGDKPRSKKRPFDPNL